MKFNISYFNQIILCAALVATSACSDFLDEEDPSNIAPETFFTRPDDAQAAVDGIYENLRFHTDGAGIFSANFQMLDAFSGTAETETGQNSDLNNLYSFQHTGDNLHLTQWWRQLYEGIANANLAIEKIPTIPGVPAAREAEMKRWIGHAKFLRALHYFYLVRLWGDIPLLTKPIYTFDDPNVNPAKSSIADVYALIEADLTDAENAGFPWMEKNTNGNPTPTGRASLAAVKSLMAQVYLTMAGYPLEKAGYYQKAADKAKEVIDYANANPGDYTLFPNYEDLHNPANENKGEHIFMIQYASGVANANYQTFFLPNNTNITASGEVGTTVPTANFLASFEAGDKRMNEKEFFFKQYGTGGVLNRLYVYKHFDRAANGELGSGAGGNGQSGLNYPLIRYAEILLIYAEAQNKVSSGPTPDAYNALKAIRDRANLITPLITAYDMSSFQEAVWRERWHELCYEGVTFFDMLRLRKIYIDTNNTFVNFEGSRLSNNVPLERKHLLLPYPAGDYRNNTNLAPNNFGW